MFLAYIFVIHVSLRMREMSMMGMNQIGAQFFWGKPALIFIFSSNICFMPEQGVYGSQSHGESAGANVEE